MSAFSLVTATNVFKRKFWKMSDAVFNASNVVWSRIEKNSDFVGKDMFVSNPLSFSEREAIKASETSEGAFVKAMQETVKKTLESFMRNCSRQLFNDGSGVLAKGAGASAATAVTGNGSTATPYVVVLTSSTFFDANLEERDLVNIVTGLASDNTGGSAEATALEIVAVDVVNYTISLVGTSARLAALVAGTAKFATTDGIVMQNSYLNDLTGLRGISNQKRYELSPKDSKYSAQFSFDGLQFMSTAGIVPVVYDRFVKDDEIWLLNDNYITMCMRPGGAQWFEEDGTVFLRDSGSDSYSARYGLYGELYIIPTFHSHIFNLAV